MVPTRCEVNTSSGDLAHTQSGFSDESQETRQGPAATCPRSRLRFFMPARRKQGGQIAERAFPVKFTPAYPTFGWLVIQPEAPRKFLERALGLLPQCRNSNAMIV